MQEKGTSRSQAQSAQRTRANDGGGLVGLISESDCLHYLEHVLEIVDAKGVLPELTAAS